MKNIVILISGRGSNMQALITACHQERWPARIVAVISNQSQATGLNFADNAGIATHVVDHRAYATRAEFDQALRTLIDELAADILVLAGFMRILTPGFVTHYSGRLVNIHPSLLPAFPGLATHQRALEAGVKIHGATVHFVSADLDHGPIIAQAFVPVEIDDDEAQLAQRVLAREHVLYPRAVRWLVEEKIALFNGQMQWIGTPEHALIWPE